MELAKRTHTARHIGFQTVLAVIVCCSVLIVAGLGFYGAQQMEIQNLKNELKAYVADGLVPAGSMDASVTLNIEAVGGRVANLQKMLEQAETGKLSNEELLWIGTELNDDAKAYLKDFGAATASTLGSALVTV